MEGKSREKERSGKGSLRFCLWVSGFFPGVLALVRLDPDFVVSPIARGWTPFALRQRLRRYRRTQVIADSAVSVSASQVQLAPVSASAVLSLAPGVSHRRLSPRFQSRSL